MLPQIPKDLSDNFPYTIHHTGVTIQAKGFTNESTFKLQMVSSDTKSKEYASDIRNRIMDLCMECIITENVDVSTWPEYEINMFFIQLYRYSKGSMLELGGYKCNASLPDSKTCTYTIPLSLDLSQYKMYEDPDYSNTFDLGGGMQLVLNPITPLMDLNKLGDDVSLIEAALHQLIVTSEDGDTETHNLQDESHDSKKKLIDQLSPRIKNDIATKFFNKAPTPKLEVELECPKCNNTHYIVSTTIDDFFT